MTYISDSLNLHGAIYRGNNQCVFNVWAPLKEKMRLKILGRDEKIDMTKNAEGYFSVELNDITPNTKYFFLNDEGKEIPDPASHYQPDGVHGPSQIVDHAAYQWNDLAWRGIPFRDIVLYELHVGTFTREGTFEAIIPRLDDLMETGINAIEIMPVSQFPGERNWGYDGVFPYAIQNSYGGPEGLKKLVDACHQKGIAVFLDVVYNHIGPEGNYLSQFGPYFSHTYNTPWGDAINFDGNWSDGVRDYFCGNALYWLHYFHLDGLRFDAIHAIYDNGAKHFLRYLNDEIRILAEKTGMFLHTIAESDLNNPIVINHPSVGGYGFTGQWLDDFHHALYTLVDLKGRERYVDFGKTAQLAKAYKDGFVHSGQYVSFRKRKYGTSSAGIDGNKFVAFILNHDQAGNRVRGERLSMLVDHDRIKLASAGLLLAPYVPMLFMGEEYGEDSPFFYFISHSDKELIKAVQKGRQEEFKDFKSEGEPADPADVNTFQQSMLKWENRKSGKYKITHEWYKTLIAMRREHPALRNFNKDSIQTNVISEGALAIHRMDEQEKHLLVFVMNFKEEDVQYLMPSEVPEWNKLLDSRDLQWNENNEVRETTTWVGQGQSTIRVKALSVVVYSGRFG